MRSILSRLILSVCLLMARFSMANCSFNSLLMYFFVRVKGKSRLVEVSLTLLCLVKIPDYWGGGLLSGSAKVGEKIRQELSKLVVAPKELRGHGFNSFALA